MHYLNVVVVFGATNSNQTPILIYRSRIYNISVGVGFRLLYLPFQVYALKSSAKNQHILPQYLDLQRRINDATKNRDLTTGMSMSVE